MDEQLVKRAKEIIAKIIYITIATVTKEGKPWNTPVFSAYDKDYNFYWGSYRSSEHSKNIRVKGNVFFVIYDSSAAAGMGEGVYIKATAMELKNLKEIEFAHHLLQARRHVPYWKLTQVTGNSPIRLYKAKPEKIWVNTEGEINGNYIDKRTEIKLL